VSARPLDRTTGHSDGKSTRLCSGTQWRLSATARLAWYGGESHRRYPAATERLQTSETMPKRWSEFSVLRAVPRKGGRALTHTATSSALPATRTGAVDPHDRPQRLLPAQPALTHRCWPRSATTAAARQQRRECDRTVLISCRPRQSVHQKGRSGHSVISGSPPRGSSRVRD
jgi:hypothetical protein